MLVIKDLDKLKIKRVTDYKIYFNYDEESYFIKTMDDKYDTYYDDVVLFKRKFVNKRIVDVEWLETADISRNQNIYNIIQDIRYKTYPFKKSNLVYKFIDKLEFVKILTGYKLVELQLEKK